MQLVDEEFQEEYEKMKNNKFVKYLETEMTSIVPKSDVQCFGLDTGGFRYSEQNNINW